MTKNQKKDVIKELSPFLVEWYRENKRDLPWRQRVSAYHVWVSEIMLQLTRVEAVKAYYERFTRELPEISDLANVSEERLLKLWEGLGYYNRVRNMQIAAKQIMEEYGGSFPEEYDEIIQLKGIGSYTAGAISSFAFGKARPAVDGNVLRVLARILGDDGDIAKASVKKQMEELLFDVIPKDCPGDFNQGLIELGAIVCVPNGEPKCGCCPVSAWCQARIQNRIDELPVKSKAKSRKVEKRTVFILKLRDETGICKRADTGLLAGMYELPNVLGHLSQKQALAYVAETGYKPLYIEKLPDAKHIFSHVEWQMKGYAVLLDEIAEPEEKNPAILFRNPVVIEKEYAIPSAFAAYMSYLDIKIGGHV